MVREIIKDTFILMKKSERADKKDLQTARRWWHSATSWAMTGERMVSLS